MMEEVGMDRYRYEVLEKGWLAPYPPLSPLTILQQFDMLTAGRPGAPSPHAEIRRTEILNWVCDSGAQRRRHSELLSSYYPGTGRWVLERAEFKEWHTEDKAIL
jgi:hypothetical protein